MQKKFLTYIKSEIFSVFLEREIISFLVLTFVFHFVFLIFNIRGANFFLIAIPIIFATISITRFLYKGLRNNNWRLDYIVFAILYLMPVVKIKFTLYNFIFHILLIAIGITIIVFKNPQETKLRTRLTLLLVINFVILLIPASALFSHTRPNYEKIWGSELSWSDFQKELPANRKKYAAGINTEFYAKYNRCFNTPRVLTVTVMNRQYSWASAIFAKYNGKYILNHEKIHFDISEWTRREFKDSIDNIDKISEKNLQTIYEHFREIDDIRQGNYDKDSDHGRNVDGQQKWNEKIYKCINE